MPVGSVKWFDAKKGYGFIEQDEAGGDVFVHFSGIVGDGYRALKQGDRVEFELTDTDKGVSATNVRVAGEPQDAGAGDGDS